MKLPKITKKLVAISAAAGIAMGAAGIAAAYFTANVTGTGHAVVGTSGTLTASFTQVSPAKLYPTGTQTVTLKLTNAGTGKQHYAVTAGDYSLKTTTTNHTTVKNFAASTTVVSGCKASWFSFRTGTATGTLAHGATTTITVKVEMSNGTGAGSTQDPCRTVQPSFKLKFTA